MSRNDGRMRLRLELIFFFAILIEARKQKSWLGPNRLISRVPVSSYNSLLTESNGKVYGFGGLAGYGGDQSYTFSFPIVDFNFFFNSFVR